MVVVWVCLLYDPTHGHAPKPLGVLVLAWIGGLTHKYLEIAHVHIFKYTQKKRATNTLKSGEEDCAIIALFCHTLLSFMYTKKLVHRTVKKVLISLFHYVLQRIGPTFQCLTCKTTVRYQKSKCMSVHHPLNLINLL